MAGRSSHRASRIIRDSARIQEQSEHHKYEPADKLVYLIVLVIVAAGLLLAWAGAGHAVRGAGLIGCALLVAALARLVLPERYAALLVSRRKALDVLMFSALGTAVLAVAFTLT